MTGKLKYYCAILYSLTCMLTFAQGKTSLENQSEELGKVHWYRDYEKALTVAQEQNKEVLILFQEVPGCSTCRNYGHNVLSHPLMVEAIENLFVPLAIFNNKGGKDKEVLNKYKEPSWNNPVVRIVNRTGDDVVSRIGNDYAAITLCQRMKQALKLLEKPIPEYLNLLEQELLTTGNINKVKEKYYKMYCFWTGEKQLGKLDPVLSTQSGFIGHSEVVKVKYNSEKISEVDLDSYAKSNNFSPIKEQSNYRKSNSDVHYYLQHTPFVYIPLTEVQKTKINSALGQGKSPIKYLSPKQIKWLNTSRQLSGKKLFTTEFRAAWAEKENS